MSSINDNKAYIKQNKKLMILTPSLLLSFIIMLSSFFCCFMTYITQKNFIMRFFIAGIISSIFFLVFKYFFDKTKDNTCFFSFSLKETSYSKVDETLSNSGICKGKFFLENSIGYRFIDKNTRTKLYLLKMEKYNEAEFNLRIKNLDKSYKRIFKEKNKAPMSLVRYKVILVFVDNWSENLEKALNNAVNENYTRVEAILFYVVFNGNLYIPPIHSYGPIFNYISYNKKIYNFLNGN